MVVAKADHSEDFLEENLNWKSCEVGLKKDSGRSWLVCLGGLVMFGICMGINNSFGVLFVSLTKEFPESRTRVAWIGSFEFIIYMAFSPFSGYLNHCFGFRRVVFVGSVLLCLGLLLSSFVKHIAVFFLTYGVILGTGTSLTYIPCLTVVPLCFDKYLATASGLIIAANGGFTMWFGPLYEYLIRHYGWRMSLRVMTIFIVPLLGAVALFPSNQQIMMKSEEDNAKVKASIERIFKNKGFVVWLLLMTFVYFGLYVPLVHLMSFCRDIGIATYISVHTVTLMCGMETFGKAAFGKLVDNSYCNVYVLNVFALLLLAVSITLLPLAKYVSHVFIFAAFFGLGIGLQALCVILVTPRLTHPDDSNRAIAYLFGVLSLPGGVGPAFAAWIFDLTHSYHLALFIAGGFFAFAACLGTAVPMFVLKTSNRCENVLLEQDEGAVAGKVILQERRDFFRNKMSDGNVTTEV